MVRRYMDGATPPFLHSVKASAMLGISVIPMVYSACGISSSTPCSLRHRAVHPQGQLVDALRLEPEWRCRSRKVLGAIPVIGSYPRHPLSASLDIASGSRRRV